MFFESWEEFYGNLGTLGQHLISGTFGALFSEMSRHIQGSSGEIKMLFSICKRD